MPTTGKELFPPDGRGLPSARFLSMDGLGRSFLVDRFGRADFLEVTFSGTDRAAERGAGLALPRLDLAAGDAGFFRFMIAAAC